MTTIVKSISVVCLFAGVALVLIGRLSAYTSAGGDLRGRGEFGLHGFEAGCTQSCIGIPTEPCWICDQTSQIHSKQSGTAFQSGDYPCPLALDGKCSEDPPGPAAAKCVPGVGPEYDCELTITISKSQPAK